MTIKDAKIDNKISFGCFEKHFGNRIKVLHTKKGDNFASFFIVYIIFTP